MNISKISHLRVTPAAAPGARPAFTAEVKTAAGQTGRATVAVEGKLTKQTADIFAQGIRFAERRIVPALVGQQAIDLTRCDGRLSKAVGSSKEVERAAARTVSFAIARVGAQATGRETYEHLRDFAPFSGPGWQSPQPVIAIVEGSSTGPSMADFGTVYYVPKISRRGSTVTPLHDLLVRALTYSAALGIVLERRGLAVGFGSHGGHLLSVSSYDQLFDILAAAGRQAKQQSGKAYTFGFHLAAEERVDSEGRYRWPWHEHGLSSAELMQLYRQWVRHGQVRMFIDATASRDSEFSQLLVEGLSERTTLVDSYTTDERVAHRIEVSQFATASEILSAAVEARNRHQQRFIMRSTTVVDDLAADIAVAVNAEYIALGGLQHGEFAHAYNRLLDIANNTVE